MLRPWPCSGAGAAARWRPEIVGGILTILGAFVSPDELLRGYLIGFLVCLSFTLGSMAWLMIGHMTGGNWWMLGRRIFEAATKTLPLVTLMFIPILLGMHRLYLWTHPDQVAGDKVLMAKAFYLNTPGWILRAVIYFALWNVLGYLLTRWSARAGYRRFAGGVAPVEGHFRAGHGAVRASASISRRPTG